MALVDDVLALQRIDYELASRRLSNFCKASWNTLEPAVPLSWNWHHDLECEYLDACQMGQINRLIINVCPRSMKSLIASVNFPAKVWTREPYKRFLFGSYADDLATSLSVKRRDLIESPWYKEGYGHRFRIKADSNRRDEFINNHTGHMKASGIKGSITGEGGDFIIIDDPHNPKGAESEADRPEILKNFDLAWSTRLNDKKTGCIIIIMQRLHEKDLTGHLLAKEIGYEHLLLPSICEKKTIIVFPISKRVITREKGDLLHPERDSQKDLDNAKKEMGSYGFAGQHQQNPVPREGGLFKRHWWKFYKTLPLQIDRVIQVWDCASKPGISNDYSVCATWAQTKQGFYLLDLFREKLEMPQLLDAAKNQYAKHRPAQVVIEDKSAGIGLIQTLRQTTTMPIIAYDPGSVKKEIRAANATPQVEAGNCYLPAGALWLEDFIKEHEKFPASENDDQVDSTSMLMHHISQRPIAVPRVRVI